MSNFRGYLLKFGTKQLLNKYIEYKSYKVTPDQRLEIEAFRDANYLLHRVTSPNYKTKIEFNTRGNMSGEEKVALFNEMKNGLVNEQQRKYNIQYWDMEKEQYITSATGFYMPDIQFTIKKITDDGENSKIVYEPIRIAFIEY